MDLLRIVTQKKIKSLEPQEPLWCTKLLQKCKRCWVIEGAAKVIYRVAAMKCVIKQLSEVYLMSKKYFFPEDIQT